MSKKLKWAILLVVVALFIDQALKIWVKTHMYIGENSFLHWGWDIKWAQLLFVENRGMAFGMELPGNWGKFILTSLRLVVISFIGYYIFKISKKEVPLSFVLVMAMIFAGAAGNLFDSLFYGLIFEKSPSIYEMGQISYPHFSDQLSGFVGAIQSNTTPAKFVPWGSGYDTFMHGKVVDMFYFPMFNVNVPNFVPIWGGTSFMFFEPVFNVADSFITVGVLILLIFGKKWFSKVQEIDELERQKDESEQQETEQLNS